MDMTKVMFGANAVHIPMWMWVQDQDSVGKVVTFVGSSKMNFSPHPAKYGSEMTHQFILGEMIIRPHLVFESNHYRGTGLAGLVTAGVDEREMLENGHLILDPMGKLKAMMGE